MWLDDETRRAIPGILIGPLLIVFHESGKLGQILPQRLVGRKILLRCFDAVLKVFLGTLADIRSAFW